MLLLLESEGERKKDIDCRETESEREREKGERKRDIDKETESEGEREEGERKRDIDREIEREIVDVSAMHAVFSLLSQLLLLSRRRPKTTMTSDLPLKQSVSLSPPRKRFLHFAFPMDALSQQLSPPLLLLYNYYRGNSFQM